MNNAIKRRLLMLKSYINRSFIAIVLMAVSALVLPAQRTASNPLGGNLTVQDAGTCSTIGSFLWQVLPSNAATTTVNLSGTFSGTVTVRESNNGGGSWTTAGTQTTVGTSSYSTSGFTDICADVTTYTSGTISVTISTGLNTGPQGPAGSGGGVSPTPGSLITFGSTVNPLAYGAKWDVKAVTDCTFTNASNVVTCPSTESKFTTSATLGQIAFGTTGPVALTTGCNGATCGSVVVPLGFICTITNDGSISIGTTFPGCAVDNATATCTPSVSTLCSLIWGTQDDSAAIQNAAAAAWTGNSCKTLEFPSGMAFFTVPAGGLLNVTIPAGSPCAGSRISDMTQGGAQVAGQGSSTSVLVPLPSVNFANCTGGQSGTACIAGPPNWIAHDAGVWGFSQSDSGTTHANNLIEFYGLNPACTATAAWNMDFSGWETASTNSQGFVISYGCGTLYASNVTSEGFGNTNCAFTSGGILTVTAMDCFGSSGGAGGASLLLNMGNVINSTGSNYWGVNASIVGSAAVKTAGIGGGTFNSFSDTVIGATNGNNNNAIYFNSPTPTFNLSGTTVQESNSVGTGNSQLINCPSQVCTINAFASNFKAVGTKMAMFTNGTVNFVDACSNSFVQGSIANTSTINSYGSCSVTGTNIAASNLVLSAGWGASAAWTSLTGATQSIQGTITNTGAGQAANPTITYTFPTPYPLQPPAFCSAYQVGGTQAILAATEFLTPSALTKTGVTFTYNGTPTVNLTEVIQILCTNQ